MKILEVRNVNLAYRDGMSELLRRGEVEESRAGGVIVYPTPVTTIYHNPTERVLFDAQRNANPFFHLMECVWMLAGARDGRWLDRYVKDFSSRYAESGGDIHGAYGHRWRKHFGVDQFRRVVEMMRTDPTTRRAVIGMWDPSVDLGADVRDMPCNTQMFFRARRDHTMEQHELDVTVLCRSNDAVWGCWGANAVHMSMMAEVLAAMAGMRIGRYYQVSNNLHIYQEQYARMMPLRIDQTDPYSLGTVRSSPVVDFYTSGEERMAEAEAFVRDCSRFYASANPQFEGIYESDFMNEVVVPMETVHSYWRGGHRDQALGALRFIRGGGDWRLAAEQWMRRRIK